MTMSAGRAEYRYYRAPGILERAARALLNNFVVEAVLVLLITLFYIGASGVDHVLGTRLRRTFVGMMHAVSRDRLNFIRKARMRHVFKKEYGMKKLKIKLAGGSYWLSIPCIVRGIDKKTHTEVKYLAKIMNERSAVKHRYMTLMRKMGVIAEGVDLRFDEYHCGREMGEYEKRCLERLRDASVNAPKVYGLHNLGADDYMLVMQFIEGTPLSKVTINDEIMDRLFIILRKMRENGIFHGDVKMDNFMLSGSAVYVFDCLKIDRSGAEEAAAFDLACLLCALADRAPAEAVLARARQYYSASDLERAAGMIDMALYKSDLELSEDRIKKLKQNITA